MALWQPEKQIYSDSPAPRYSQPDARRADCGDSDTQSLQRQDGAGREVVHSRHQSPRPAWPAVQH